jgi:hypothetical protein
VWQIKAADLMVAMKKRAREKGIRDKIQPSKAWPQ